MTLTELRSFATRWKKKLRLQDWKLTLSWMSEDDANGEHSDADGYCSWNAQHKLADIVVKRTADDPKRIVVHELLHLLWEGNLERGSVLTGNLVHKEIAINVLSEILVK